MEKENLKKQERRPINFRRHFLAFCFTIIIFSLGFFISNHINSKRLSEIDEIKREVQVNIKGMELQLAHFKKALCPDISDDILTNELHSIERKLNFMKNSLGYDHPEVTHLKKYFSLLQIRHYHFSQQLCERCNLGLTHILYFFADEEYCPNCEKQTFILTYLRRIYPHLRIYSFNYHLDLLALNIVKPTVPIEYLINNKENLNLETTLKQYLPIIVINGEPHFGFKSLKEIRELIKK